MWALIVELLLGSLFLACVVNQFRSTAWERWAVRIDRLNLLPHWGFFAPEPGHTGNHLVYRDLGPQGWSSWTEIALPGQSAARWIWNPGRFERKALLDLVNGFTKARPLYTQIDGIQLSECYLAMLTWVMAQEVGNSVSSARQFAVIMSTGHGAARTFRVALVSNRHVIDRA